MFGAGVELSSSFSKAISHKKVNHILEQKNEAGHRLDADRVPGSDFKTLSKLIVSMTIEYDNFKFMTQAMRAYTHDEFKGLLYFYLIQAWADVSKEEISHLVQDLVCRFAIHFICDSHITFASMSNVVLSMGMKEVAVTSAHRAFVIAALKALCDRAVKYHEDANAANDVLIFLEKYDASVNRCPQLHTKLRTEIKAQLLSWIEQCTNEEVLGRLKSQLISLTFLSDYSIFSRFSISRQSCSKSAWKIAQAVDKRLAILSPALVAKPGQPSRERQLSFSFTQTSFM